jgi:plastocyanin
MARGERKGFLGPSETEHFMKTQHRSFMVTVILVAGAMTAAVRAEEWRVLVGQENHTRGSQALAFLPNELWIHAGDIVRYVYPTHERHTLTFLKPGQTRPPGFGPTFGVVVGCPGTTPDGSSYNGSACVTSDVLMLAEDSTRRDEPPSYSVTFPAVGNFKFVCLIHADMTGVVHVVDPSTALPHDQEFYDRQTRREGEALLANAASLAQRNSTKADDGLNTVAVGIGEVETMTGAGSQTASLMRFVRRTIAVHVGDTVVWTSLDPSINHTVTFGAEPADPRPASASVSLSSDGARQATIGSPADNVNSGFLSPTPQDRANLAQSNPGVTRFRVTFTTPGTFNYICAVHDQLGMAGTVIVQ